MKKKVQHEECVARPVKVILFGDSCRARGIFLRMLQQNNNNGTECVNAIVIKDKPLNKKEYEQKVFNILLEGKHGESLKIDCVDKFIDGYNCFDELSSLADDGDITTLLWAPKATEWLNGDGSVKNERDNLLALITMLLFRRFCQEKHGYFIVPSTDDDMNGLTLKEDIISYASLRGLGYDFINWLGLENTFANTLVQCEALDECTCERNIVAVADREIPFSQKFFTVTNDFETYINMRRFVYYGALYCSCAYAYLNEIETVADFMANDKLKKHMTVSVFEEIIPSLAIDFETLQVYTLEMLDRLSAKAVVLSWEELAKHIIPEFADCVMPTLASYRRINGCNPKHLTFAVFCTVQLLKITEEDKYQNVTTAQMLKDESIWGMDASFLCEDVLQYEAKL